MFDPALILMAPLFLFTGLFIGIWRLLCVFGVLCALPVVALILGAYLYNKRNNPLTATTLALAAEMMQKWGGMLKFDRKVEMFESTL